MIIAFGDDLTYGFGVEDAFNYPTQIESKTGLKIMNAGVHDEFSSAGLTRLPSVLKHKPSLVILCHGANDIFYKHDTQVLKENLLAMINLIQKSGSKVLLVGVSNFAILSKDTHKIYNEVAEESDVAFEDNTFRNIFKSNLLKSDYRHPNAKGYLMIADAIIEKLELVKITTLDKKISKSDEYKELRGMY